MKLEAPFSGGGRPRPTPEEMQEAKDMTRKKIEQLNLGTRSTDRTREISKSKMDKLETNLAYNKLANQLIEVDNAIAEILKESVKNGGRIDKEKRTEMKELKAKKKEIENAIADTTESDFWRGDQAAA